MNLAEALITCGDLLIRHGGHAAAAGFDIATELWPAFAARFLEIVTAEAGNLPIQVVIPPGNRPKRDDTMQLAREPEYVLLFDTESKQAIHAPSGGSATAHAAAALV